jgi:bacillithiol system protein YtxJ
MNWKNITSATDLEQIKLASQNEAQVIFKHSTRCSISTMAKSRLERSATGNETNFYYLDLIAHRDLSNKIAEDFDVAHESPQVLVIKNGACSYDESHNAITMDEIVEQLV